MLTEIRIQNFAIIDALELSFGGGLNVITGETGAGKSIIIDAVELLLGGKADASSVRAGAERALVEGVFALNAYVQAELMPILQREDLVEADAPPLTELTISREVRASGRSIARVEGVTVNLDILGEIGEKLVDVHGQSAHLSLLKPSAHIDLLDRYATLMDAREALSAIVVRLTGVRRDIKMLLEDEASLKRRALRLRDEVDEIDASALVAGEDDLLKAERTRLANSEQLARLTAEAVALLYGSDELPDQVGAVDQVMQAVVLLGKLATIDAAHKDDRDILNDISAQIEEISTTLRRYLDDVEYNPERLEEVEERLELISTMKKRYSAASIAEILAYADKAREELESLENSEERLAELRESEQAMLLQIGELGERISRARNAAAQQLGARIVTELGDLRMASARFEVSITQVEDEQGAIVGDYRLAFDHTGLDHVEFMMSANPGEPLRPLAKVASGGEAARIMLALKRVLTAADHTPTLIFDEIDTGIGGRVGAVVGEKLWELTGNHQVMVVTHLAQLAGYADRHFHVRKLVDSGRTRTQIEPLAENEQRAAELAAMLGTVNEAGLQSARELLSYAGDYKRQRRPAP
ncbi:MAG: DNA repair protein RecN [Pleurocapsa minor GSE-CHR-MK-17-07R]|jgi:DNA repair protein RecN (Recombination protein N)|nr:DNA repair protein RecN [Pleurocapsa minor GSE-CHR-MK 17-07R]